MWVCAGAIFMRMRMIIVTCYFSATDDNIASEVDLCKVCMDAIIDCILLECGHMVTCTQCGRRMAECPICRHYVSRVVHVFKA